MTNGLNNAKLQLFHRLYEQVEKAQTRAINFYEKEAERVGLIRSNRKWFHGDIARVDYDGVVIKWDEYSRSCHVDGGHFDLPWEALADDTYIDYITRMVGEQVSESIAKHKAEKEWELKRKQEQLAKLKAELGEN